MANISNSNKIRLETYKSRLNLYYQAEEKILQGQSYSIGSRNLTRANLNEVIKEIKELESKVCALENRGTTKRKVARIVPTDF